jgi:hypothetical protein
MIRVDYVINEPYSLLSTREQELIICAHQSLGNIRYSRMAECGGFTNSQAPLRECFAKLVLAMVGNDPSLAHSLMKKHHQTVGVCTSREKSKKEFHDSTDF